MEQKNPLDATIGEMFTEEELKRMETDANDSPNPTGTVCSVCGAPQYNTPSGITCSNGHGRAEPAKLGATNEFPDGKITEHDEDGLMFNVGHTPDFKRIVIEFGKPISWMAMDPSEAETVARGILSHVKKCKREKGTRGNGVKKSRR